VKRDLVEWLLFGALITSSNAEGTATFGLPSMTGAIRRNTSSVSLSRPASFMVDFPVLGRPFSLFKPNNVL